MIVELECVVPDGTDLVGVQVWPYVQHLDGSTETTKLDGTTITLPAIPSNTDVTFNLTFYGQNKVAFNMTGYTCTVTSRRRATSADPVFANAATIDGVITNLMTCLVSRDQTADEDSRTNVYGVIITKTATDRSDSVIPQSNMEMRRIIVDPDAVVTVAGPDMILAGLPEVALGNVGQVLAVTDESPVTLAWETRAKLDAAQTYSKAQCVAAVALSDDVTIATDASLANVFTVTLGGNRTLANPSNLVSGGTYLWVVTQDGGGSRTLAFGSVFKWAGGVAPTLSTAGGSVDLISAVCHGANLLAVATLDLQ